MRLRNMFDPPNEEPIEPILDPAGLAKEKSDEFRMYAEIAAVFEGRTKFDAQFLTQLQPQACPQHPADHGPDGKSPRFPASPFCPSRAATKAADLLNFPATAGLSTNDYHIHRRPGELMIVRWLQGPQVETFYQRIQAHFDAALDGFKEDERQAKEWQQDPKTLAYLAALDAVKVQNGRPISPRLIREYNVFVLSTQTADEINISYLCDYVMGSSAAEIVGPASAPPDQATDERDLAWFYKLFSLRGMGDGVERMCFFTYLEKSEETFESEEGGCIRVAGELSRRFRVDVNGSEHP